MKKNPIVPFLLIFALGLGLIFFLSLSGLDKKAEITQDAEGETEETAVVAEFDPDVTVGKCISCHGGDLEGGGAPALAGTSLSEEDLVDIMRDGVPGTSMPGGLVEEEHLDDMADYILSLK